MSRSYLSIPQVAERLSMSSKWVWRHLDDFRDPSARRDRDLSIIEISGEIRIARAAFDRFCASRIKVVSHSDRVLRFDRSAANHEQVPG